MGTVRPLARRVPLRGHAMRQRRATALSTAVVSTKVTPDERQILLDRANALGVALSEYIRQTALAEAGAATINTPTA